MSYHVEDRCHPDFERWAKRHIDVNTTSEVPCPHCDGTMYLVDNGVDEAYMFDGTMEREERYYCDDCGTFADVVQVYKPASMRVSVKQDVFED